MASLTRGISFRRQGSSGMSWTDTWSFNEDGVLVRTMKEEPQIHPQQRFGGSSLSRIHDSHDDDDDEMHEACENEVAGGPDSGKKKGEPGASASSTKPTVPTILRRSKSVGSAPNAAAASKPQKSSSRFFKWLKKAFVKRKN